MESFWMARRNEVSKACPEQAMSDPPFWLKPLWLKPFWLKPFLLEPFFASVRGRVLELGVAKRHRGGVWRTIVRGPRPPSHKWEAQHVRFQRQKYRDLCPESPGTR